MALLDIDLSNVPADGESKKLPVGEYLVRIESNQITKSTKEFFLGDGTPHPDNGKFFSLLLMLKVFGGPEDGAIEPLFIPIRDPNETREKIGQGQLKKIKIITKIPEEDRETDRLNGKWLIIRKTINKSRYDSYSFSEAHANMIPASSSDIPFSPASTQPSGQMISPLAQNSVNQAQTVPGWARKIG